MFAATAFAGKYEDALAAYERRDFATAVQLLRPLANAGNAAAQTQLGIMYSNAEGVPYSCAEAQKWYLKAVDQNYAEAKNELGRMYFIGGDGVPMNTTQALTLFRKSAEQGFAGAQNNLGLMYLKGEGVTQDYVEAHKWFNLAASRLPVSSDDRYKALKNRDDVAARMTPQQIAEAQKLAREWKPK